MEMTLLIKFYKFFLKIKKFGDLILFNFSYLIEKNQKNNFFHQIKY